MDQLTILSKTGKAAKKAQFFCTISFNFWNFSIYKLSYFGELKSLENQSLDIITDVDDYDNKVDINVDVNDDFYIDIEVDVAMLMVRLMLLMLILMLIIKMLIVSYDDVDIDVNVNVKNNLDFIF